MTVRVVIADDQRVVREGLASMLELFDGIDVVGIASSAEEALDLVAEHAPEVVLTDLRMPGIGGCEGIRRLRAEHSGVAAVALTTYDDDRTILEALTAGACGFLNKDADAASIEAALLAAAQGRSLLDARVLAALLGQAEPLGHTATDGPPAGLTERELEVIALIARGRSNAQIARELVISMATVKTHVNHVLAKTGCRDRAALVAFAFRRGLAER